MSSFVDRSARSTHFLGFDKLMQLKLLRAPEIWGPSRITLEIYIYMLSTSSTFYPDVLSNKSLEFVDDLVVILDQGDRILGTNIYGLPHDIPSIVYRLSWLKWKDLRELKWSTEMAKVLESLEEAPPDPEAFDPSMIDEHIAAVLYHAACSILAYKIIDRDADSTNPAIRIHVQRAATFVISTVSGRVPQICLGWPLVILATAATNEEELALFRTQILNFINVCGMVGFSSVIEFLEIAWGDGIGTGSYLGLDILFDKDLLQTVHI